MDRKKLVDLFQNGMQYPPGKHRFWVSRCFEINVRSDSVVELDEYEGFSSEVGPDLKSVKRRRQTDKEMFHVGRSMLDLRAGQVREESGEGWGSGAKIS
jgi:hypothetical protein